MVDKWYFERPDWYRISVDTATKVRERGFDNLDIRVSENGVSVGCRDEIRHFDRQRLDGEGKFAFADAVYRLHELCAPPRRGGASASFEELYNASLAESVKGSAYLNAATRELLDQEASGAFGAVGVELLVEKGRTIVIRPIREAPAERAGILPNDVITHIGNESTTGMALPDVVRRLRGTPGTTVTLRVQRAGQAGRKEFAIKREVVRIGNVTRDDMGGGVAHVKLRNLQAETDVELDAALRAQMQSEAGLKGLVLDLRDNPGGLLDQATTVAGMFLDRGPIMFTDGRHESQKKSYAADGKRSHLGFPIVVLVNRNTSSGSEIVAAALRDHRRAVILGTRTFGRADIQCIFPFEDGSALRLATALIRLPDGRTFQDNGIVPDILVDDLGAGNGDGPVTGGKDRVLEEGLQVLRSGRLAPSLQQQTPPGR